jgi:hypothetical protein
MTMHETKNHPSPASVELVVTELDSAMTFVWERLRTVATMLLLS